MEDVDEKGVIFLANLGLVVTELYQASLSHPAGRYDYQVVAVGDGFDKPGRFRNPVAKVLRDDFSGYYKRVCCFGHSKFILNFFSDKRCASAKAVQTECRAKLALAMLRCSLLSMEHQSSNLVRICIRLAVYFMQK